MALRFQSCGSSQGCASSPTFPRTISPFSVLQVPLNLVQGESSGGLVLPSGGDIVVLVLPDSHYLPPNNTPPLPLPIPDKASDLDWAVAFQLHDTTQSAHASVQCARSRLCSEAFGGFPPPSSDIQALHSQLLLPSLTASRYSSA